MKDVRSWRLFLFCWDPANSEEEGRREKAREALFWFWGACALRLAPNGMGRDGPMIINNKKKNNKSRKPSLNKNQG